jgi:uncharacterized protein (DUF952 family)
MTYIYHIADKLAWQQAQTNDEYVHPSLKEEGFIHCSIPQQILGVTERYYQGVSGLVLLKINSEKVQAEIKYENDFPHIYGPINIDAVEDEMDFPCKADGSFELPTGIH